MNAEFINALSDIEKEKGVSKNYMLEAIEAALAAAYKRDFGPGKNVRVSVDRQDGDVSIYVQYNVVEEVENDQVEMALPEARRIRPTAEIGEVVEVETQERNFGRIAAQTAKQVVVQRLREAERGMIFDEFAEKENEVLTATVQRVEKGQVYVELGRTEGVMPASEQMHGEKYMINDRFKVYVVEVRNAARGPQVTVSRSHPGLVKRLFEMEVPEIQSGVVQVKFIAREAGQRTKMAVASRDPEVDPIGACVGQRGSRVEKVVEEIRGEKIDIIRWSSDPAEFIGNALSPARVVMVTVNPEEKAARVIVPDNQLSLAIGKEGQNARLAARLTGWKIDIKSQSQTIDMLEQEP